MTERHAPGDSPGIVRELVRHVLVRLADRIGERSSPLVEVLGSLEGQVRETRGIASAIAEHLASPLSERNKRQPEREQPQLVQLLCCLALEPHCSWVADQQWIESGGGAELGISNRTNSAQVFRWELRGPIDAIVGSTKSAGVTCLYGGTSGTARVPAGAQVTMMVLRSSGANTIPLEHLP